MPARKWVQYVYCAVRVQVPKSGGRHWHFLFHKACNLQQNYCFACEKFTLKLWIVIEDNLLHGFCGDV